MKGTLAFQPTNASKAAVELPCGKCIGCRLERARQWAVRLMHEAKEHELSAFVTLTYSPEKLPADRSVSVREFQLFMKRLRKAAGHWEEADGEKKWVPHPIRFFACGEYGESLSRPHYHAILFGVDFPDKELLRKTPRGDSLYRSATLERLWGNGHCSIGAVSFESARYVAAYCVKKIGGAMAESHYRKVDPETGELYQLTPEFVLMSRRPGIGHSWFAKYGRDVYPADEVIVNGMPGKPPKYYDNLLEKIDPELAIGVKQDRLARAEARFDESSPARLRVREEVKRAKISVHKRESLT